LAELRAHFLPAREIEAREQRARLPTGAEALDRLLGGGWPRGGLSLVRGGRGQGRTAVMLTSLAATLRAGHAAALIDFGAALDPAAAARAGVPLERLLWVRGSSRAPQTQLRSLLMAAEAIVGAGGFGLLALDFGEQQAPAVPTAAWLRLRRLAAAPGTVLLVVAARPLMNLMGATAVSLEGSTPRFGVRGQPALLTGIEVDARLGRGSGQTQSARTSQHLPSNDAQPQPRLTLIHRPE
jgi:hypothetical protein